VRIGNERLCKGRLGRHHGPETAGYAPHRAEEVLAAVGIDGRIVKRIGGGPRSKAIWEISAKVVGSTGSRQNANGLIGP